MRFIFGAILLIFLGTVGIFAVQNTQPVAIKFLNWGVTPPVALLSVTVYFLGMVSGWTVIGFIRSSIRRVTTESRSE